MQAILKSLIGVCSPSPITLITYYANYARDNAATSLHKCCTKLSLGSGKRTKGREAEIILQGCY